METDARELKRASRWAGAWYLLWAATGLYSMLYVPRKIIVPGDAAATGINMLANELLFRTLIMNDLLNMVFAVILLFALYRLFVQVNERHAKLMVALLLLPMPAIFMIETCNVASLMIFKGEVLKALEAAQRQDVAMLLLKFNDYATATFILFWGLWLFPLAMLVYRSGFLPRFLGVWLGINGIAYVAQSAAAVLLPGYKDLVFSISWPAMLGEFAFLLWLLIRGARLQRGKEPAGVA